MKIKILQCTCKDDWYKNRIGEILIVTNKTRWYYWVTYNNLKGVSCMNVVKVSDCEITDNSKIIY